MTDLLRHVLEQLENLPEAAQNEAAQRIQAMAAELADRRWDELFADSRSEQFFASMAEQYEQAKRDGSFRPLPSSVDEQ